jgi:hypothetical protein
LGQKKRSKSEYLNKKDALFEMPEVIETLIEARAFEPQAFSF